MLGNFFTARSPKALRPVQRTRPWVERLENRDCPSAPQITLNAQILSGHEVQLTGLVTDDMPAGVTVNFSGATSGSTTTDANGHFIFTTEAATLGSISAVGVDQSQQTSNTATAMIQPSAPVLTLAIANNTTNTVTLTGSVSGVDNAGQTVTFSGVAIDSVVTDSSGNFSLTTALSGVGTILATSMDLWGQSSNTAQVTVSTLPPNTRPQITLTTQVLSNHQVVLTGVVTGNRPAKAVVTFSGAFTGTTKTDNTGHFSFTTTIASLGTVQAVAMDTLKQTSNTASATIATHNPNLTLAITNIMGDTATISGKLTDVDPSGQNVGISGAMTGSVITDANGNFSFTTDAHMVGSIFISTTDLWGQSSNSAEVDMPTYPPAIRDFSASTVAGNAWTFRGRVLGLSMVGLFVDFGGLPSLENQHTVVQSDGWFSFTVFLGNGETGTASAQVTDQWGRVSNRALTTVA